MCVTAPQDEGTDSSPRGSPPSEKTSVTDVIADIAVRPANVHKLLTKEDGRFGHVHKIIGTTALVHYIYRAYLLITTGSMQVK